MNGTFGAGLVIFSTAMLALMAMAMMAWRRGPLRAALITLSLLDIIGTGAAAWFLHEWALIATMTLALAGVLITLLTRAQPQEVHT